MARLPPLAALRAFEAAARHLSFAKAAQELNVTPAAVSHQIKALEEYLGVQLFRRMTRAVLLTEAAQEALPALREGFERIGQGVAALEAHERRGALVVSVAHSFAGKWLVPRLHRFSALRPEIDVRIDPSMRLTDFARDEVDVAIRYGLGRYPGLRVEHLFATEVFPVCSPRLLEGPRPLNTPDELRHHTLLHVDWSSQDEIWPDWPMWLRAAGVDGADPMRGPRFTLASLALQAAVDGHGVVLGEDVLVADDIAAGRLVRPFALALPVNFCYWLVCPEMTAEQPKIAAFRAWLFSEIAGEAVEP